MHRNSLSLLSIYLSVYSAMAKYKKIQNNIDRILLGCRGIASARFRRFDLLTRAGFKNLQVEDDYLPLPLYTAGKTITIQWRTDWGRY